MSNNPTQLGSGEGAQKPHPNIEVFYQVEGRPGLEHLEAPSTTTLADLRLLLLEMHALAPEALLFLEDHEEPAEGDSPCSDHSQSGMVHAHVHKCSRIKVIVNFQGMSPEHAFGPGTTMARVKEWFTKEFHLSPTDAGEYFLQLHGINDRPAPNVHLGTLTQCPACLVTFDLVSDVKIQG